jgi:hypothetical protein
MNKIILWTGVKSPDPKVKEKWNYSNYEWMDYSRKTWEYYANRVGATFIPYETPSDSNTLKVKINWQRWLDLEKTLPKDWDQVLSTDASIMVKWDTPDMFELFGDDFMAVRGTENMKWTYESVMGYKDIFPKIDFMVNDYFASGFIMFSKKHKLFWDQVKKFYYENQDEIIRHEDEIVKRGRDQPVLNYLTRVHAIPIKYFPLAYGVNHLYRREILGHNWQLERIEPQNPEWKMPHFIKHFYIWIFSGFSDRGDTRTKLMSQTWNVFKNNYESPGC